LTQVVISMPQMAARGLSENWLFRHAGAVHWEKLCASLGVESDCLVDTEGRRVYSSFIAIRTAYELPLTEIRENQRFTWSSRLSRFGQSIFTSGFSLVGDCGTLSLELATKFVARVREGGNELVQATVRPSQTSDAPELDSLPESVQQHRSMRGGALPQWTFGDFTLVDADQPLGTSTYEPTPYVDFNGAGLFYFASYPTVADSLERRIVMTHGLARTDADWALAAGTVAREVYYFGNLDLGGTVRGELRGLDWVETANGRIALTHITLADAADGRRLAEVYTAKSVAH